MKSRSSHPQPAFSPSQEKRAWKKWNRAQPPMKLTPEQILTWLDQTRSFMFEVWRRNPRLRKKYERQALR